MALTLNYQQKHVEGVQVYVDAQWEPAEFVRSVSNEPVTSSLDYYGDGRVVYSAQTGVEKDVLTFEFNDITELFESKILGKSSANINGVEGALLSGSNFLPVSVPLMYLLVDAAGDFSFYGYPEGKFSISGRSVSKTGEGLTENPVTLTYTALNVQTTKGPVIEISKRNVTEADIAKLSAIVADVTLIDDEEGA